MRSKMVPQVAILGEYLVASVDHAGEDDLVLTCVHIRSPFHLEPTFWNSVKLIIFQPFVVFPNQISFLSECCVHHHFHAGVCLFSRMHWLCWLSVLWLSIRPLYRAVLEWLEDLRYGDPISSCFLSDLQVLINKGFEITKWRL